MSEEKIACKAHYCKKNISPFVARRKSVLPEDAFISKTMEFDPEVLMGEIRKAMKKETPPGYRFIGVEHAGMPKQQI